MQRITELSFDFLAQAMDDLGPRHVADVLGYQGPARHGSDSELAEGLLEAFDGMFEADAEQALRVLAMAGAR